MCGFVGFIKKKNSNDLENSIIKNMNKGLSHRGPDNEGYLETEKVSFGFSRLSILDLSPRSNQPMTLGDSEYIIVFNGEIYNYLEIKNELKEKCNFKTTGDTEVLLNAYKIWGKDCLLKIKGMFSFCIYDLKKKILFCARDHFGQKPFFYFFNEKNFVFSSELRSLLKYPKIHKILNKNSILNYLHYDAFVGDQTIIKDCYKLEPASYLIYDLSTNSLKIKKYWKTDFSKKETSNDQEQFERLFLNSSKQHLRSDVPIALYLSGGIDSSSIACMSKKVLKYDNLKAFTLKFGEKSFDEDLIASDTAKKLNIEVQPEIIKSNQISHKIMNLIRSLDEPLADIGYISNGLLAERLYKENFKVVLSGDGGDELFGGYEPFLKLRLFNLIKNSKLLKGLINFASNFLKDDFSYMHIAYKIEIFKKGYLKDDKFYNSRWLCSFLPEEIFEILLDNNLKNNFKEDQIYNFINKIINETNTDDQYDILLNQYQRYYLPDLICSHTDKANMIYSIEARSPFLDKDLFELMNKTKNKKKYNSNFSKIFLRKFLKKNGLIKVSESKKKKGFAFPVAKFINYELKNDILESFNKRNNLSEIIKSDYIQKYLSDHYNKKKNNYKKIWNLFILNEWINYNL